MGTIPENTNHVQMSTYDWETGATTYNAPAMDAGQRFRCAISQATEAARKRFPHSSDRIEKAYALVHEGKVVLHPQTKTATVGSSDGTKAYTVNGHCDCPDAPRAPEGVCKHKFAALILRKASVLVKAFTQATEPVTVQAEAMDVQAVEAAAVETSEPEAAPAAIVEAEVIPSVPHIPREFLYEVEGATAIRWGGLLHLAHQAGLCSMTVEVVTVSTDLAVMRATATFNDGGVWTDIGDSSPQNVSKKVGKHFIRMASTRAMARCLRTAMDIPFVSSVELDE